MLGLDTNVVIRYITQDDVEQAAKANDFFENQLESFARLTQSERAQFSTDMR